MVSRSCTTTAVGRESPQGFGAQRPRPGRVRRRSRSPRFESTLTRTTVMQGSSRTAIVAAFAAIYLIWGSTYLAIRLGVATVPPFLMAGVRFLVAGLAFMAWAKYRRAARPTARDWLTTGIIGVLMATGGNGLVTWAMQTVQSGLAALLVSMVPFWVVMVDWLKPQGRRPTTRVVVGLVLGFTGVALLINPGDVGMREIDAFGALTIVLASMLWASGSIYSRHAPQPTSQALSSGMQMFGGGVVLLGLSAATGEVAQLEWASVSNTALAGWVYVTVLGSVAYGSYLWLLKASTPTKAATYAYVNPVIALILGYLVADESLSPRTIGCSALVVLAVLMVVSD